MALLASAATAAPHPAHRQTRSAEKELVQIAELLEVTAGKVVADVGAGGGQWAFGLADRVGATGRVYATEVKQLQVDGLRTAARARGAHNVDVVFGSQDDMGLPKQCCDAALLRLVYHAFDSPDRMRSSLHRAVKPGGRVLIIDFRPTPDQLTQELKTAGFDRLHFIERWQDQEGVYAALFQRPRS
jgi:ubiquinone/menaquinone biosynthesis C-methylase UbiE